MRAKHKGVKYQTKQKNINVDMVFNLVYCSFVCTNNLGHFPPVCLTSVWEFMRQIVLRHCSESQPVCTNAQQTCLRDLRSAE